MPIFKARVVDESGDTLQVVVEGKKTLTPESFDSLVSRLREKFPELQSVASPADEEAELASLEKKNQDLLGQKDYERMRSLQNKRSQNRQVSEAPAEGWNEAPQTQPTAPAAERKKPSPSDDLEDLTSEERQLAGKNPDLMSQKEWEKYRRLTGKKLNPKGGGMFGPPRRRPGIPAK